MGLMALGRAVAIATTFLASDRPLHRRHAFSMKEGRLLVRHIRLPLRLPFQVRPWTGA
jgi:hypothetical protein